MIFARKTSLSDPVLLGVMEAAEADAPAVGRLESHATIGSRSDVRALDREALASGHAAMVLAHPRTVSRAGSQWFSGP